MAPPDSDSTDHAGRDDPDCDEPEFRRASTLYNVATRSRTFVDWAVSSESPDGDRNE